MKYSIVGQKFRGLDPYLPGIKAGVVAELVREPNNQYDRNAVAVWIDGKHVGYLPSKQNAPVAAFIDEHGLRWHPPIGAADSAPSKAVVAKFVRSSNSSYPQVELIDGP